mgnify:FL=1|jgi:DNA-binding transcriptional LysR family regulator
MLLDDELELFLVIPKAKSFSQAAKKLHMSRQALTNKIKVIESKYGIKFYNRTPKGVTLTEGGKIVTKYAKCIANIKRKMDEELAALQESYIPSLTIGGSFADGAHLIPKLINSFRRQNPDVKIHLDIGYEPELFAKMYNSQIDFSIIEDQCNESDFNCHLLGYKRLVCLAPNLPPWNILRQPVNVRKLLPLPKIIYEWDSGRHLIGDRHFRREGYKLSDYNVVVRLDSYEAMIEGILNGLGYGWFPAIVAEKYQNNPRIITIDVDTEPVYYEVNLVYHKMNELSDEAKAFIKLIKEQCPQNYFDVNVKPC